VAQPVLDMMDDPVGNTRNDECGMLNDEYGMMSDE
jgi:hypothetical protein